MARVAVNAMSLRKGGGLQVMAGLVSRFSPRNTYVVLWTDPQSIEILKSIAGEPAHVTYLNPLGSTSNAAVFLWGLLRQKAWLEANAIDCVLGVNHHFDSGDVAQVIYHLNVLRFERPRAPLWRGDELADRLRDWRARKALQSATANLFESQLLLDTARRVYPAIRKPQVVYIGLDDRRPARADSAPTGSDAYAILAVTSAAPHKDNATLVRMLAELVARHPAAPWRLRIAGGGGAASFADVQALASQLGVSDRIDYLGFLRHDQLSAYGRRSLCLVTTSLAESFCMVALEAMSWGCPAIVSDISSMPESVGDAGLLARPSDAADFADKVEMLRDEQFRQKKVADGLRRATSLTWTSAAAQVEDAIAAAVSGR